MISDLVTPENLLRLANAVACTAMAITMGTFQRPHGARHRYFVAFLAWLLIVACGSVPILVYTGQYEALGAWPETVINVAFAIAIIAARGNIMRVFRPAPDQGVKSENQQ